MDDQNVTTKEAAARLGISVGRIRQLVLAGGLPAQKFGRDLMIKVSDLADVKVYGKRGRPAKKAATGEVSTATGAPAAAIGDKKSAKKVVIGKQMKKRTGKKATAKASKR